ncbi:MAG TPA: hypothetical protein PKA00_20140 [Saprospiraceae bacterium]|nr:hypothetical protein [Saprospiraceae bacterium]HMQ85232.1 hypothetical protein [Saprospiraceae bacterium]
MDRLELKIRQAREKMGRIRQENTLLLEENKRLKAELDRQKGAVRTLKDKLTSTQQVADQERKGDGESLNDQTQVIKKCIQEIDKCIEWLHNH